MVALHSPIENMPQQRSLLNRLQLALSKAVRLVGQEREHHALSYRSMTVMDHYAQILPVFARDHLGDLPGTEWPVLARCIEWADITAKSAAEERERNFERVKRNSIIVLAAIVEGAVESVVATCLKHLKTDQISLKALTGFKGKQLAERDLKYAVRTWEKNLFEALPSRAQRIAVMVATFFPRFELPPSGARLDKVFDIRNRLTHELIVVTDEISDQPVEVGVSLEDVDGFFDAAGELVIAIIKAIPADLAPPLPVFGPNLGAPPSD